jgi:NADPH:quinone reductase-like Zn-dependent oxidoreductase
MMRFQRSLLLLMLVAGASNGLAADALTMRAAVAGAGTVRVQTLIRPSAAADEVLVKVHFAGVNPADWKDASEVSNTAGIPGLDGSGGCR